MPQTYIEIEIEIERVRDDRWWYLRRNSVKPEFVVIEVEVVGISIITIIVK